MKTWIVIGSCVIVLLCSASCGQKRDRSYLPPFYRNYYGSQGLVRAPLLPPYEAVRLDGDPFIQPSFGYGNGFSHVDVRRGLIFTKSDPEGGRLAEKWFILDPATKKAEVFDNEAAFQDRCKALGVSVTLVEVDKVIDDFQNGKDLHWFPVVKTP